MEAKLFFLFMTLPAPQVICKHTVSFHFQNNPRPVNYQFQQNLDYYKNHGADFVDRTRYVGDYMCILLLKKSHLICYIFSVSVSLSLCILALLALKWLPSTSIRSLALCLALVGSSSPPWVLAPAVSRPSTAKCCLLHLHNLIHLVLQLSKLLPLCPLVHKCKSHSSVC